MNEKKRQCESASTAESSAADYKVSLVIGEGSFGRVWYGQHKATGRNVAIKVIDKCSCQKHPNLLASVLTEQSVLKSLRFQANNNGDANGDFVVQLLASFHDTECLYMVMDCHMGGTLQNMITDIFFSSDTDRHLPQAYKKIIPWYARQLFNAVCYVHRRGIVHGDVKPSNVLVSCTTGRVKLADFGSAIVCDDGRNENRQIQPPQTCHGTTSFTAPEFLGIQPKVENDIMHENDDTFATRAMMMVDLWSLGCTLFALWVGQSPFDAPTDMLIASKVSSYCETRQLPTGSLPVEWIDLLQQHLLHVQPTQRCGGGHFRENESKMKHVIDGDTSHIYPRLWAHSAWSLEEDNTESPSYLPPEPLWLQQVRNDEAEHTLVWRDGSLGWSAFLL